MKLNIRSASTQLLVFASVLWAIQYIYYHQHVFFHHIATSTTTTHTSSSDISSSTSIDRLKTGFLRAIETNNHDHTSSPAETSSIVPAETTHDYKPVSHKAVFDDVHLFPEMSTWQPKLKPSRGAFHMFLEPDRSKTDLDAKDFASPPPPGEPEETHPIRIAYIFAGSVRSFKCPKVQWSLRFNVIDAFGGEAYTFIRVSEEDNDNVRTGKGVIYTPQYEAAEVEEALKILNPRKIVHFNLSTQLEEMRKYHSGIRHRVFQENDLRRYSMYFHRSMGYRMAREYEAEHGIRFDWVALIRLDAAWLEPVAPIQYYANDRVWLTETGYTAFNDQFMLIPRQYSDYIYNLDTKVQKGVYCLGGPDVEKWKCNRTELVKHNYSPEMIEATLEICCPDVRARDVQGYSEIIHLRHMQFAKVPVAIGRFTVYITRYLKNRDCYADCPRLHYNFKDYLMEALQREYPYWAPMNELDTRQLAVVASDSAKCAFLNHMHHPWQPLKAVDVHRLMKQGKTPQIDYSKNLYAQWDKLHPSLKLNPNEFNMWRIHPTRNTKGCLTYGFKDKSLFWRDCETHVRIKGGRRFEPAQTFHVFVQPPKDGLLRNPVVNAEDQAFAFEKLRLPNITMVSIFDRTVDFSDLKFKVFCMTVHKKPNKAMWDSPFEILMTECVQDHSNKNQLFYTVQGGGLGSHPSSTVGMLRSVAYPDYCIAREDWKDEGMEPYVVKPGLGMELCRPVVDSPGREYFEFELIPSL